LRPFHKPLKPTLFTASPKVNPFSLLSLDTIVSAGFFIVILF
jgi:hypothetical protein